MYQYLKWVSNVYSYFATFANRSIYSAQMAETTPKYVFHIFAFIKGSFRFDNFGAIDRQKREKAPLTNRMGGAFIAC